MRRPASAARDIPERKSSRPDRKTFACADSFGVPARIRKLPRPRKQTSEPEPQPAASLVREGSEEVEGAEEDLRWSWYSE